MGLKCRDDKSTKETTVVDDPMLCSMHSGIFCPGNSYSLYAFRKLYLLVGTQPVTGDFRKNYNMVSRYQLCIYVLGYQIVVCITLWKSVYINLLVM